MKAEIISIGTEILLGEITDTNAQYMASRLPQLGIDLYWISQVGDNRARIIEVLRRAWNRSDVILVTGGLGPTDDDVTRDSIAGMFGEKMHIDPGLEQALRARFAGFGGEMPPSNLRQAMIIPSAETIPNPAGTAPGWWIEKDGRILATMPGPPRELDVVWRETVQPRLEKRAESVLVTRIFKTFGYSEGGLGEMVSDMLLAANPTLGIYAKADGIHLRLAAKAPTRSEAERLMVETETRIRNMLGDHIWGIDDVTLERKVGELLLKKNLTLAVMEDGNGYTIAPVFAGVPGSKTFFRGGLIAPGEEAKKTFGIDVTQRSVIPGPELAEAMSKAARKFLGADIGIGVTGTDAAEGSPFGTLYVGIADSSGSRVISRPRRPQYLATAVLFELWESLRTRE